MNEFDDQNDDSIGILLEEGLSGDLSEVEGSLDKFDDVTTDYDATDFQANLAAHLDNEQLSDIARYCTDRYEEDLQSRSQFDSILKDGMDRLGLKLETLNDPYPGASGVRHPIIMESAVKTQAKIMNEVFGGKSLCKTWLAASASEASMAKAARVENYMNYQLLQEMKEYLPETGRLTFRYALTGNAFRKFYYDPIRRRNRSRYVTEDRMIVNDAVTILADADFYTEKVPLSKYDFEMLVESNQYVDPRDESFMGLSGDDIGAWSNGAHPTDLEETISEVAGDTQGVVNETPSQERFSVLEHYAYLKLPEPFNDDQEVPLPYIISILEGEGRVLSVRRNWRQDDDTFQKRVFHSHYKLFDGLGFYGYGYFHLYGNFQAAMTQIMRSVLDAGQFANMQGGFKSSEARYVGDASMVVKPGYFKDLKTNGVDIRQVIMPFNFKEPSQVLTAFGQWMDGRISQYADSAERMTEGSVTNAAVGSTLALLETATKLMNGVLKRFYMALDQELKILHDLNSETLSMQKTYYMKSQEFQIEPEDFDNTIDVVPAADPNLSTNAQRMSLANAQLQAALQAPQIHDTAYVYKKFYVAIGVDPEEVNRLIPPPAQAPQPQPLDPMSDIMAASQGKPIKAFPEQDHASHIKFKEAFLQDPMGGKNPTNANLVPIIQANIQEHTLLEYQARVVALAGPVDATNFEFAITQAAEKLVELNNTQMNSEALASGDPATMLAQAEIIKAQTAAKDVELRKELKKTDQMIDIVKAQNAANRDQQKIDNTFKDSQIQHALGLIEKSMAPAKAPKKD